MLINAPDCSAFGPGFHPAQAALHTVNPPPAALSRPTALSAAHRNFMYSICFDAAARFGAFINNTHVEHTEQNLTFHDIFILPKDRVVVVTVCKADNRLLLVPSAASNCCMEVCVRRSISLILILTI